MKEIFKQNQFIIVFFVLITLSACGGNNVVPSPNSPPTSSSAPISEQDVPEKNRTTLGLYLTSLQTFKLLSDEKEREKTLFLDVRTGEEYEEGTPTFVDNNVPIFDTDENNKYVHNPEFISELADELEAKGLNQESRIILICQTGNRSARAVKKLAKAGYKNVYTVIDGIEGWKKNGISMED